MKKPRLLLAALLCSVVATGTAQAATSAQDYPSRPITLVVPYNPGASTDFLARLVGQKIGEQFHQPVVVENRGGAAGMIGTDYTTRSAPDGYTFQIATDGTHTGNPFLRKNFKFDPRTDVTPITLAAKNIIVLVANPSVPVKNISELIEYSKKNPGKLFYGTSGTGSPHHLSGVLFNQMAKTDLIHVAYKSGGPAVTDVLSGQIPLLFASLVSVMPHIQAGKLTALGVTEAKRYDELPNVQAIAETLPGYQMQSWLAFSGPAGMPKDIVNKLNGAIVKALKTPQVTAQLKDVGLVVVADTPEEFRAQMLSDFEKRGRLIRENNISAE